MVDTNWSSSSEVSSLACCGVVDHTRELELSVNCTERKRYIILHHRYTTLTGSRAIGPVGKNLCQAVLLSPAYKIVDHMG